MDAYHLEVKNYVLIFRGDWSAEISEINIFQVLEEYFSTGKLKREDVFVTTKVLLQFCPLLYSMPCSFPSSQWSPRRSRLSSR